MRQDGAQARRILAEGLEGSHECRAENRPDIGARLQQPGRPSAYRLRCWSCSGGEGGVGAFAMLGSTSGCLAIACYDEYGRMLEGTLVALFAGENARTCV